MISPEPNQGFTHRGGAAHSERSTISPTTSDDTSTPREDQPSRKCVVYCAECDSKRNKIALPTFIEIV